MRLPVAAGTLLVLVLAACGHQAAVPTSVPGSVPSAVPSTVASALPGLLPGAPPPAAATPAGTPAAAPAAAAAAAAPPATPATPSTPQEQIAFAVVGDISRRGFGSAEARFDSALKEKLPGPALEALWNDLLATQGNFVQIDRISTLERGAHTVVLADLRFDRRRQRLRMTIGPGGMLAGLFHGPVPDDVEADARGRVDAMSRGDAAGATRSFSATMQAAVTPDKVMAAWQQIMGSAGPFVAVDHVQLDSDRGITTAVLRCRGQRAPFLVKVSYDPSGDVAGLWILPGT